MAVKLWTVHFMRICVANLLLFISLYVLFPVLPIEMSERLGLPVTETGVIFLFFTLGMFLIGPFHAYLVDAYKRKNVCLFSFALMVAATVGYAFVTNITELILLSTVQGLAFGIATTAGITLAIDITNSTLRSAGNVSFSWIARLGMILGIILGVWFDQHYAFKTLLTVSVTTGALGILTVAGVYVPFRAPFVTKLYSFDRFLLGSCHKPDPDNVYTGVTDSACTSFPQRYRTGRYGCIYALFRRSGNGLSGFPGYRSLVYPERENAEVGDYGTRIGDTGNLPVESRLF